MKKEISPGIIIAAIVGLVAVIGVIIFMAVKSDPAMQAPHEAPRFDPGAKNAESHSGPGGQGPSRGPMDPPPGAAVAPR
jgi:hypothetical protein